MEKESHDRPRSRDQVARKASAPPRLEALLEACAAECERLGGELVHYLNYDTTAQTELLAILARLAPVRASGFGKVRVGGPNDGGYVMIDDFDGVVAAYSIGIERDVAWDLAIAARGVDVFQYDHTIEAPPAGNPRFIWKRLGLGPDENAEARLTTLARMIEHNGHGGARDLLLKIDIEAAEWDVLAGIDPDDLRPFRQIVVELHWFERAVDPAHRDRMRRAVAALTAHHSVVHVHANNWALWSIVGGVPVPRVLEFTLLRADEGIRFELNDETFPTALDAPNCAGRIDYPLGLFRFSPDPLRRDGR